MAKIFALNGLSTPDGGGVARAPVFPVVPQIRMAFHTAQHQRLLTTRFFLVGYVGKYDEFLLESARYEVDLAKSLQDIANDRLGKGHKIATLMAISHEDAFDKMWPKERTFNSAEQLESDPVIMGTHSQERIEEARQQILAL